MGDLSSPPGSSLLASSSSPRLSRLGTSAPSLLTRHRTPTWGQEVTSGRRPDLARPVLVTLVEQGGQALGGHLARSGGGLPALGGGAGGGPGLGRGYYYHCHHYHYLGLGHPSVARTEGWRRRGPGGGERSHQPASSRGGRGLLHAGTSAGGGDHRDILILTQPITV